MTYGCIFDMDGVLVDSGEAHYASWARLGQEIEHAFTRDMFDRTFGMHNNQIVPLWLGREVGPEELDRLALRKETLYREAAPGVLRAIPGAVELVRALHADGFLLAVGSSGPTANVALILELLEVRACFTALSTGDEVVHGKPDPEVFNKAAQKLGLPASRCIVIEDAPQGVEAALNAGMRVVAVTTGRPREALGPATRVVDSLAELSPELLRGLIDGSSAP